MAQEKLLNISDIADELNTGPATIKFLLKRFKKWLPFESVGGHPLYEYSTLQTLIRIQDLINTGVLPSEIEAQLDTKIDSRTTDLENQFKTLSNSDDIRLSSDGLSLLKSLFQDIGDQQKRIAEAHEKRAHAEERKAVAIEKRAEAEEKKAEAMNNIASALQEMNHVRSSDVQTAQIVQNTASILVSDPVESDPVESDPGDSELADSDLTEEDNQFDEGEDLDNFSENDNMSDILEDEALLDDDNLLDEFTEPDPSMNDLENDFTDELADSFEDETAGAELDDLSSLVDDDTDIDIDDIDLDINDIGLDTDDFDLDFDDAIDEGLDEELDDLSKLINDTNPDNTDNEKKLESDPLDDLSLLVESDSDSTKIETNDETSPLDDLSALIDSPDESSNNTQTEKEQVSAEPSGALDDLSLLLDEPDKSESIADTPDEPLDDLASLLDEDTKKDVVPEIKIDITPEQDVKKYKAAIMQVILGLKKEGLSPQEATERLNGNNIKTISGKPKWSDKAISQIYTFIESAK